MSDKLGDDEVTPVGPLPAGPVTHPFEPTKKPERPLGSPVPQTAELLKKANETEKALLGPGYDKTNASIPRQEWNRGTATNGYVARKGRTYALAALAAALGVQLIDHTLPLLFEFYEKHLDRQEQRQLQKTEAHP